MVNNSLKMTRRNFLGAGAAALAVGASGCRVFTGAANDFDDSLAVFLSDIHLCADPVHEMWHFTRGEFDSRIADILRMRPLPRNVIVFGDLCFNNGDVRDYRMLRLKLDLLTAAGVRVTLGMGNHDRRNTFLEVFPEYASSSPVPGRIVSVVKMKDCDLVLLDSLKGKDGEAVAPSFGELDKAQQEWLASYLPKCTHPTFVGAHHPARELRICGRKVGAILEESPKAVGWINGHEHCWMKEPVTSYIGQAANQDTIRGLYLPSAGFWGDIGSVTFRTTPTEATATLVQTDYWFNSHLRLGEKKPEVWQTIIDENRGRFCRFPFARAYRKG